MARRAAGRPGPLHSAQDPAPWEPDPVDAAGGVDAAGPEDLERLRASLLRAARAAPLRVEDPVHLPPGSGGGRDDGWAEGWVDPDALAGGESAVMHPDDLAALHALPTSTAETRAWTQAGAQGEPWAGPAPGAGAHQGEGRRLVGTAPGLSLWDDDPWDGGRSWDHEPTWDDGAPRGLLHQRWLQLALCALLGLVVGACLALLVTGRQVDAARAEAERQREAASSAQADLVRERAARAPEGASSPTPPPAPAAPLEEPASTDPATVVPLPPSDQQRPPVVDGPAPTADPGPPPPGPSPSAAAQGQTSPAPSPARSSPDEAAVQDDAAAQDDAVQGDPARGGSAPPPDGQGCSAADGTGGDGPTTCP